MGVYMGVYTAVYTVGIRTAYLDLQGCSTTVLKTSTAVCTMVLEYPRVVLHRDYCRRKNVKVGIKKGCINSIIVVANHLHNSSLFVI